MAGNSNWTKSFFVGLWSALNFSRKLFFNLIFIALVIGFFVAISGDDNKLKVTSDSILHIPLNGRLVIEEKHVEPFEKLMQEAFDEEDDDPEVLVRDLVFALENAAQDNRIKGVVIDTQRLASSSLDKLRTVAQAISEFKSSEKPIYAIADYYTRDQYYLAAHTDKIILNPMGGVVVDGYSRFGLYLSEFLQKLKINTHIFRVGTYKSAVEPYMRNDMSDEAKTANSTWLNRYWKQYKRDVSQARTFSEENFDESLDELLVKFQKMDGDFAQYALEYGWVDELMTREQVRQLMQSHVKQNDSKRGYAITAYKTYMSIIKPNLPALPDQRDKVAVVVASGTILDGEQNAGNIGGDSTAQLLRKARLNNTVKAVVLRVDSPGGSAFASEIIRQEVLNLKEAGKPVVVQMGSYAASGGYWISSSSDYIVASESTITGSIGVFGLFMTYENSLDYLGINSDGVSSSELADFSPARGLKEGYADLFQLNVENTYRQFISMVAEDRNMDIDAVDDIAQGRVWIGEQAIELGLVDELGNLDTAVSKAAELASITDYKVAYVKRDLSAQEMFWQEFFGQAIAKAVGSVFPETSLPFLKSLSAIAEQLSLLQSLNDPKGVYVLCMQCETN